MNEMNPTPEIEKIEMTGKVRAYIARIWPAGAKKLLANQYRNRPLNKRLANLIAVAILKKNFPLTGESIIIAENGQLVDGQTRLNACVLANEPIVVVVVEGISLDAISKIDIGTRRSGGARLYIEKGLENGTNLHAVAAWIYRILKGDQALRASGQVAYEEVSRIAEEWEAGFRRSMALIGRGQSKNPLVSGCGFTRPVAFHAVVSRGFQKEADEFFVPLSTGLNLSDLRDPRKLLLDRLMRGDGKKADWPSRCAFMGMMAEMWNAFASGRKVKGISYRLGNPIPDIIGVPTQ